MTITLTPRRLVGALLTILTALALGAVLLGGPGATADTGAGDSTTERRSGDTFPKGFTPISAVMYLHREKTVGPNGATLGSSMKCPRGTVIVGGSSQWQNPGSSPPNYPPVFDIRGRRLASFQATNAYDTESQWNITLVCGRVG